MKHPYWYRQSLHKLLNFLFNSNINSSTDQVPTLCQQNPSNPQSNANNRQSSVPFRFWYLAGGVPGAAGGRKICRVEVRRDLVGGMKRDHPHVGKCEVWPWGVLVLFYPVPSCTLSRSLSPPQSRPLFASRTELSPQCGIVFLSAELSEVKAGR